MSTFSIYRQSSIEDAYLSLMTWRALHVQYHLKTTFRITVHWIYVSFITLKVNWRQQQLLSLTDSKVIYKKTQHEYHLNPAQSEIVCVLCTPQQFLPYQSFGPEGKHCLLSLVTCERCYPLLEEKWGNLLVEVFFQTDILTNTYNFWLKEIKIG